MRVILRSRVARVSTDDFRVRIQTYRSWSDTVDWFLCTSRSLLLLLVVTLLGCDGNLFNQPDYKLGVPYRAQAQFNYCVPASIQMWRLYDGLSNVSQTTIFNTIGGAPCDPTDAAFGVGYYTNSGSDAHFDHEFTPTIGERDQMISRQITSIDTGIPVMALVRNQTHVGIVNGGKYEDHGSYLEWEFLYFHDPDPAFGQDYRYSGGDWLDEFCSASASYCGQIVSTSATAAWSPNLSAFGDSVAVYGGGGGCLPSECGPPPV